jgi:hypothetical protein
MSGAPRLAIRVLGAAVACALVCGCSATATHTFADRDAEQVWTAMVAVAGQPRYDDWTVVANEVWVDAPERRIEIHRQLERVVREPGARSRRERRTWSIEVRLPQTDPPQARFVTRGATVPSHARAEAMRYFDDVADLLGGLPGESGFGPGDQDLLDSLGLDE